ncbi:hypothetical protein DFH06DRAFT_1136141 [Mycena polygramma]|nr:hypothetical protein DFH06DRAFT_1136141 [Mycena polygramma]
MAEECLQGLNWEVEDKSAGLEFKHPASPAFDILKTQNQPEFFLKASQLFSRNKDKWNAVNGEKWQVAIRELPNPNREDSPRWGSTLMTYAGPPIFMQLQKALDEPNQPARASGSFYKFFSPQFRIEDRTWLGRLLLTRALRGWGIPSSGLLGWVGAWWLGSMPTALDSPIPLLPPEITAAIFEHCLPPYPRQHRSLKQPWPSPGEAPLLLGQICRQWREISLNTPTLWQTIAFADSMSVELLKVWLSRTRGRPLYLYIIAIDAARADLIMRAVMPYCSQWQDVCLRQLPLLALLHLDKAVFPRLERLNLSSREGMGVLTIQDAPLLREANIHRIPIRFELPLSRLTCMTLNASIAETIGVLRCCPNLVTLDCNSMAFGDDVPPPLELPLLRSLDIATTRILACLTVPRLEQLQIFHNVDIDAVVDRVQALVSRSSCELQYFAIRMDFNSTEAQCRRLFHAVDAIHRLKLIFDYSISFEQQIQALSGPVDVLPRLKHLEMFDLGGGPPPGKERSHQVLDLLRWRREHAALESFDLLLRAPWDAIMDGSRALAEDGLQLRVMMQKPECTLLDTFTHRKQPLTHYLRRL